MVMSPNRARAPAGQQDGKVAVGGTFSDAKNRHYRLACGDPLQTGHELTGAHTPEVVNPVVAVRRGSKLAQPPMHVSDWSVHVDDAPVRMIRIGDVFVARQRALRLGSRHTPGPRAIGDPAKKAPRHATRIPPAPPLRLRRRRRVVNTAAAGFP
jgi:hypothetical protein